MLDSSLPCVKNFELPLNVKSDNLIKTKKTMNKKTYIIPALMFEEADGESLLANSVGTDGTITIDTNTMSEGNGSDATKSREDDSFGDLW